MLPQSFVSTQNQDPQFEIEPIHQHRRSVFETLGNPSLDRDQLLPPLPPSPSDHPEFPEHVADQNPIGHYQSFWGNHCDPAVETYPPYPPYFPSAFEDTSQPHDQLYDDPYQYTHEQQRPRDYAQPIIYIEQPIDNQGRTHAHMPYGLKYGFPDDPSLNDDYHTFYPERGSYGVLTDGYFGLGNEESHIALSHPDAQSYSYANSIHYAQQFGGPFGGIGVNPNNFIFPAPQYTDEFQQPRSGGRSEQISPKTAKEVTHAGDGRQAGGKTKKPRSSKSTLTHSSSHSTFPYDGGVREATYSNVCVYEIVSNGNHVMRRRDDHYINATHILKIAGIEKGKRTKILEREIIDTPYEKVQGGYGKYQGTWVPLERGVMLAKEYGVATLLQPLLEITVTPTSYI